MRKRTTQRQQKPFVLLSNGDSKPIWEAVNHPDHYNKHPSGVECIDIIEHMTFNCGASMKHVWRAGEKGDIIEDLRKARWYLDREISRLSKRGRK